MAVRDAQVLERRARVYELWVTGMTVLSIAKTLKEPHRTVRRDLQQIRRDVEKDQLADLQEKRARSIASLRRIQQSAWSVYARVKPESVNSIAALNAARECEIAIARMEGTWNSEITVNQSQTTNNIWLDSTWIRMRQVIATALFDHPEARLAVASALATMEMEEDGSAAES